MQARPDIVMTCSRDEHDIIEAFARFYLRVGFDRVHIIDNGSVDGTSEIVEELIAEGLPVTLEHDDYLGYERCLTSWFKRVGERFSPRWLFFLDSDEFILFPSSVKEYLRSLPDCVNRLQLKQKEVFPNLDSAGERGHFLLSPRIERFFNDTTKDVVRFHPDAWVYAGKHRIDIPQPFTMHVNDIFIRHYKYRSETQAVRKEHNRCAVHQTYSGEDLASISAFGADRAREWILYCRQAAEEERWRESFARNVDAIQDNAMADWVKSFLPCILGPPPRTEGERGHP